MLQLFCIDFTWQRLSHQVSTGYPITVLLYCIWPSTLHLFRVTWSLFMVCGTVNTCRDYHIVMVTHSKTCLYYIHPHRGSSKIILKHAWMNKGKKHCINVFWETHNISDPIELHMKSCAIKYFIALSDNHVFSNTTWLLPQRYYIS